MKHFCYLILYLCFLSSCSSNTLLVSIPAKQSLEVDFPQYEAYSARLNNKSFGEVAVAVLSKTDDRQIRGFGLSTKAKAKVLVEQSTKLRLQNNSTKVLKVGLDIKPEALSVSDREEVYISFTLENTSAKSIPLLIPNVMNPNLSPFSKSGVDLKPGQEILFKVKGKKYLLLTVDESIQKGSVIDVAKVIEERKKSLGL